MFLAILDE